MKKIKIKLSPAAKIIISFAMVILIGTFLLCLPISVKSGNWFSFVDSLFTSTSAVCVTGLVTVDLAATFTIFGQIVIMLLIQIGGLGFITISSLMFVLLGKKLSFNQRLTIKESLNQETNQGIVKLIIKIVVTTFIVEFVGFVCLAPSLAIKYGFWSGCFKALFLSVSAFCNAGMDLFGTQDAPFSGMSVFSKSVLVMLPVMLLIVVGSIGFVVIFDIFKKRTKGEKKRLALHTTLVLSLTAGLILGGGVLFTIFEWNNPSTLGGMNAGQKILNGFFQSVVPRTAGFSAISQADMTPASIVLTTVLMFIGGSPASTAGGIKTTTLFVLILAIFKNANEKGDLIVRKKRISNAVVSKCFRLFMLLVGLIVFSSFLVLIIEGKAFDISAVLFEVVSAISTAGLSFGITPFFSVGTKLILCVCMFVGRVGVLTFAMMIGKNRNSSEIEYADAKILVG